MITAVTFAEQLPVKTYTTGEGLPRDEVTLLRQDSRGFLWMAAGDGISRFDGYEFTNYTTNDGLADRRVNDLLETRAGVYLFATNGGLCRFNPTGHPRLFTVFNPHVGKATIFNALTEDAKGTIWCATDEGLFKLELGPDGGARFLQVGLGSIPGRSETIKLTSLHLQRDGVLWFGTNDGVLYRLPPGGRAEHYSLPEELPINSLLQDHDGQMWAGTTFGLFRLVSEPLQGHSVIAQAYGREHGLPQRWINKLQQTRDGRMWVGTARGIFSLPHIAGAPASYFQHYDAKNGLCDIDVWDVIEDRNGNLWIATSCGVHRVARSGFTTYGTADGLGSSFINALFENAGGTLFVINAAGMADSTNYLGRRINQFDGARFTAVEPNPSPRGLSHGWGWLQTVLQDHRGEWWIPTRQGLFRYPKVTKLEQLAAVRPELFHAANDQLGKFEIFRLYEDSRGDMWIATTLPRNELWRWDRATDTLHNYTKDANVPPETDFTAFCEDHAGNLWIGTSEGCLLRYSGGNFRRFVVEDGIPPGWIICLLVDQKGRLWIGSQLGGLNRIDDTTSDELRVARYTTANGLSSDNIRSLTEDRWGRIYVGTGHGVDRLSLDTGNVKHYTVADGLVKGKIEVSLRDHDNNLWFGSLFGLSRFVPEQVDSGAPPSIYVTGMRVSGNPRAEFQLGVTSPQRFALSSGENNVSVDFVGLGSSIGEELGYQYRLQGASSDWSVPTSERTINFANLAAGLYHFQVRARNADGLFSLNPATLEFEIAAPIWRRWWFLSLVVALMGSAVYSFYRSRLSRLLELERIRTRIATDLHDDVGSGLSQVSILSEVISRRVGQEHGVVEQLSIIGSLSRDLVDSMSDIVWAINPGRDRLSDLSHRMRRFASDVFITHGVDFSFDVPHPGRDIRLGPEMRRELYLIFKEAVNNIVRHSDCTAVKITFLIGDGALELSVYDNGEGFDSECESDGNGLANMHLRAAKLGGDLRITSNNGHGTSVHLKAPLDRRRWFSLGSRKSRS